MIISAYLCVEWLTSTLNYKFVCLHRETREMCLLSLHLSRPGIRVAALITDYICAACDMALQCMEKHDSTWQYTTIHDSKWQCRTIRDNTRQRNTIHDNAIQYTTVHDNTRQYTIIYSNTLQYTTIHDSTRQYTT